MEFRKKIKTEKFLSTHKKIYFNENDNTSTEDIRNKTNGLLKTPQEKIIGNYIIEELIDKGDISKVVSAKHIITGEKVAIKILNKKILKNDIMNLKRIKKEIQILKMVKHENIISLLEKIDNKNKIYLITDYYPNNLFSLIVKNKKLSEEKALYYFSQYINGLHYLHQNGICHRNIRPDNILLDEKNEKVKIIDFGLSTTYSKKELLSSPVGAIIYAPPEMHLSEKYSGELADIWNAGLVLYTMVCGYLPFSEEDEEKNIKHIITGFYDIPSNISKYCAEIIKSCLQVDPNKRINFEGLNKIINYTKGLDFGYDLLPIDDEVLIECKNYLGNYNNEEIIEQIKESVKNNKNNEFNSLYFLVLKKMAKKGYQSVSDLSSDTFKYYINNIDQYNESALVYKQKKISSYILKKENINNINRSYNKINKNNSLSIPSYKRQIIFSPTTIKSYESKKSSSFRRNEGTLKNIIKTNEKDFNISCKNIQSGKIKLDYIDSFRKSNYIKSISPKLSFNNHKIVYNNKFIVRKKLLYSYSLLSNKRQNKEVISRCNTTESNNLDNNTFNGNSSHIINSKILSSMKQFKTKRERNCSNENKKIFHRQDKKESAGKSIEIMRKIKNGKSIKNKTLYNQKKNYNLKKFNSVKNDYYNNNLDENNDLINILTEDKPLENFNINFNFFNNSINTDREKNTIKNKNDVNFHKYNVISCNKNIYRKINGPFRHKLKVRKNSIYRGISSMLKDEIKIKKFINNNNTLKENKTKNFQNDLSYKNSLKIIESKKFFNNNQKSKIINNNSNNYNSNIAHKKNNSAILMNIFDYNNNKYSNEKAKDNKIKIENGNYIFNEKYKNKNNISLENYNTSMYDIGVIDLCCLKIDYLDKIKRKINKVLKNKKTNYNYAKNNKYKCSKLGIFFDIEILTLENFLSLNNGIINNEKNNYVPLTKRNIQSKKSIYYLSFHIKKNDIKKNANSILKEICT